MIVGDWILLEDELQSLHLLTTNDDKCIQLENDSGNDVKMFLVVLVDIGMSYENGLHTKKQCRIVKILYIFLNSRSYLKFKGFWINLAMCNTWFPEYQSL